MKDIAEGVMNHDMSCIFIGNLNKAIPQSELHQRFQAYGNIRSCNIIRKQDPRIDVTFAFIKYTTRDAASWAIQGEVSKMGGVAIHATGFESLLARPP